MKRNLSKLKYLTIMSTLGVVMFSTTAYAEETAVENTESIETINAVTELNDTEPTELYTGWYEINGYKYYYVDNERVENSFMTIDGYTYYFNEEGIYITKSFKTIDNYTYYFDAHGFMTTGWATIGKYTYYFDSKGHMAIGWQKLNNNTVYYFDDTGIMTIGWKKIEDRTYYFNENGHRVTGWLQWNNKWYYFDKSGILVKDNFVTFGTKTYYLDSTGVTKIGWFKYKDKWMYSDSNGVIKKNKWITQDNKWYYLDNNGYMSIGWKKINNNWYYFTSTGTMKTGWFYNNNSYYYFNPSTGKMITKWLYWNNEWYYFNPSNGKMITNGWGNDAKNNWYYLDSNGHITTNGWITWSNKKFYFGKDGIAYKNIQTKINNVIYYFRSDCSAKQSEDPLAGELALKLGNLKAAFDYVKTSYKWGGRNTWDEHDTSKSLAEFGIKNNWGNCFVYAGTFRELAAEMGYDAHQVWGVVPYPGNRVVKHSWVEIVIDGTTYVYDPEASWQFKKDYYQFKYGDSGTFRYEVQGRMN